MNHFYKQYPDDDDSFEETIEFDAPEGALSGNILGNMDIHPPVERIHRYPTNYTYTHSAPRKPLESLVSQHKDVFLIPVFDDTPEDIPISNISQHQNHNTVKTHNIPQSSSIGLPCPELVHDEPIPTRHHRRRSNYSGHAQRSRSRSTAGRSLNHRKSLKSSSSHLNPVATNVITKTGLMEESQQKLQPQQEQEPSLQQGSLLPAITIAGLIGFFCMIESFKSNLMHLLLVLLVVVFFFGK